MMATQIKEQALADVDEIWGSEVNLYLFRCMLAQLTWLDNTRTTHNGLQNKQTSQETEWVVDYFQLVAYAEAPMNFTNRNT